jgi:GT2 family glycosyltransferase
VEAGPEETPYQDALDATVVIPTKNRPQSLLRTLEALATQHTRRSFEVIVVDDGSKPPLTLEPGPALPSLRLLRTAGRGPGPARNAGIREARGRIVVFTDDDTEPAAGWVEAACAFLDQHPEHVGVEGPVASTPYDPLYDHTIEITEAGANVTCNIAYRRHVLERLGGFYEDWPAPAHCEDLDLAWRAVQVGPIGYSEAMSLLHHARPLTLRRMIARGRVVTSEVVLFERHRERFGRARRLPSRLFPLSGAIHWVGLSLRREGSSLRSPSRLARLVFVCAAHLGSATVHTAAYAWRTRGAKASPP